VDNMPVPFGDSREGTHAARMTNITPIRTTNIARTLRRAACLDEDEYSETSRGLANGSQ
jgi:hypothetical protein